MHLRCIEGNNEDEEWQVGPMGAVLGRSAEADITILDGKTSRKHARIFYGDKFFIIEDLGSQNGTYVDGKKIVGRTDLEREHLLKIGDSTFLFTKASMREMSTLERKNKMEEIMTRVTRQKLGGGKEGTKKADFKWARLTSRPGSLKWMMGTQKDDPPKH